MEQYILQRKDIDEPIACLKVNVGQLNCNTDALMRKVNAWVSDMKVSIKLNLDDLQHNHHIYDYATNARVAINHNKNMIEIVISNHIVDYYIEAL